MKNPFDYCIDYYSFGVGFFFCICWVFAVLYGGLFYVPAGATCAYLALDIIHRVLD